MRFINHNSNIIDFLLSTKMTTTAVTARVSAIGIEERIQQMEIFAFDGGGGGNDDNLRHQYAHYFLFMTHA